VNDPGLNRTCGRCEIPEGEFTELYQCPECGDLFCDNCFRWWPILSHLLVQPYELITGAETKYFGVCRIRGCIYRPLGRAEKWHQKSLNSYNSITFEEVSSEDQLDIEHCRVFHVRGEQYLEDCLKQIAMTAFYYNDDNIPIYIRNDLKLLPEEVSPESIVESRKNRIEKEFKHGVLRERKRRLYHIAKILECPIDDIADWLRNNNLVVESYLDAIDDEIFEKLIAEFVDYIPQYIEVWSVMSSIDLSKAEYLFGSPEKQRNEEIINSPGESSTLTENTITIGNDSIFSPTHSKKMKRIYQIAKELNVSHYEIVNYLKSQNIDVVNHMSPVDQGTFELIVFRFAPDLYNLIKDH